MAVQAAELAALHKHHHADAWSIMRAKGFQRVYPDMLGVVYVYSGGINILQGEVHTYWFCSKITKKRSRACSGPDSITTTSKTDVTTYFRGKYGLLLPVGAPWKVSQNLPHSPIP
jgi:hypothetical protein